MAEPLRLMCVLAHPDDETLGFGGALARYAAEGVETSLVMATRGERGWMGRPEENPGLTALGELRTRELAAAAEVLGLRRVEFLNYVDGDLDRADPAEAIGQIVAHLRRARPQVVATFGPEGAYGHPDHIAICQFTTAAVIAAADPAYASAPDGEPLPPHRVAKLYYRVDTAAEAEIYESLFGDIVMTVDGVDRRPVPWPEWMITTRLDTERDWPTVWQAVLCHQTQLPAYHRLENLSDDFQRALWGTQGYYRAFSLVNGGRAVERDLFEGLR